MKHTQGKWHYGNEGVFDEKGNQVASLLKSERLYFKERKENSANAKLIASAPEMLEALQMMKLFFEDKILEIDLKQNTYYKTICSVIKQATE